MSTTLTKPKRKKGDSSTGVQPSGVPRARPSTSSEESTEEFYEDLKEAINELNEILAGKKQARPIEELLAELQSSDID